MTAMSTLPAPSFVTPHTAPRRLTATATRERAQKFCSTYEAIRAEVGKMMVGQLTDMALAAGCYKILLNCVAARKDVSSPRSAGLGPRRAARGCTALGPPPVCRGAGASGHSAALLSDCTLAAGAEKNIGFYEKYGYVVKEVSMAKYLDH